MQKYLLCMWSTCWPSPGRPATSSPFPINNNHSGRQICLYGMLQRALHKADALKHPSYSDEIVAALTVSLPSSPATSGHFSRQILTYIILFHLQQTLSDPGSVSLTGICVDLLFLKIPVHARALVPKYTGLSHFEAMNERVVGANKILVLW